MPDRSLRKQAPRKPITPGLIGPWRKLVEFLKLPRDYVQAIERAEQQAGELSTRLLGVEGVADGVVAASGQTIDHGSLSGLGDAEDHPWALLVDGSRSLTGNLGASGGVTVDSVDISAHRHSGGAGDGLPVTAIHESGGPTDLAVAAIADGRAVLRSGATLVGGYAGRLSPVLRTADAGPQALAAMPAALQEWIGATYHRIAADLTASSEARLYANVTTFSGVVGAELRLQYSIDAGSSWAYLDGAAGPAATMTTTGLSVGSWVALEAAAVADVWLRLISIGGDGVASPAFGTIGAEFR